MNLEMAREFACDSKTLWTYLTDVDFVKLWMKGVEDIQPLNDIQGVGQESKLLIREGRKLSEYLEKVIAWEPERKVGLSLSGGCGPEGMDFQLFYELEPAGVGRTLLKFRSQCEARGFWRLLMVVAKLFTLWHMKRCFRALDDLIQPPAAAAVG